MNTLIFGHRNPDTDSICSCIALSYLKNALGEKTVPRAIGHLNNETKYVLKYFNIPEPQYLNDVKIRIRDIHYRKKAYVNENDSIYNAYLTMQNFEITAIPIVNNNRKITGFLSMKDVARFLIEGNKDSIHTSLNNIINILNAELLTKYNDIIDGRMVIINNQSSNLQDEILLDYSDILIVGNRYKILEQAINSKVKLIILAINSVIDEELIEKAKVNSVTIIRSKMTSYEIANMIRLSNYTISINTCDNPITVYDDDYYDEFQLLAKKTKHTNYPIVNKKKECLGVIQTNLSNEFERKKVILVDHNNYEQSVEGIEEAIVMEIIDHHNLGMIGTKTPINFRCMTVGCTSTIIYKMFVEKNIEIPQNIAGLLLSAIISDTLLFTSPSTTDDDIDAANKLANIINIDINEYGYKMLKASSSIDKLTVNEQIYEDYKSYTVGKLHLGISQLITMDFEKINNNIDEYVNKLDELNSVTPGVNVIFITDIFKKGSYVIYNTRAKEIIMNAFNLKEIYEGMFIPSIMSRKKQMLPPIMEILEMQ